ncbi:cytochrome c oxidase subunit 12, mitochondrial [Elaeis guineensis]|uniref:Cytochrome c oxidase subunit 6b-1 n=1 Tax=Elaeis guineensis var. tenera TaxID=51953 RepID=A0A6I9QXP3_ELAGV|nr:cytochrome c oxidase subunit 6b-1 [Elaeis guineensis]
MAEAAQEKNPSLAEQWSLQDKEDKSDQSEVPVEKTAGDEKPADVTAEEVVTEKTDETPVADDTNPVAEENSGAPEQEETESQEAAEEKPVIKLETAPADFRFPTTNQTRHCFTRYIEYHKCVAAKGEGAPECEKFAKYYRSLCPSEWIERWNEQRENGTFPGPL